MKFFFDTSVLIPVFLGTHAHHKASLETFVKADRRHSCCGAHSVAEVYSTLTRLPGNHRLSAEQALLFVAAIRERLTLIALDADEYAATIEEAASAGIVGGMIYDLLLARCALKARAEVLYTWNVKHFQQFGPDVARRVRMPASIT